MPNAIGFTGNGVKRLAAKQKRVDGHICKP